MVINQARVQGANATAASQLNTQMATKLVQKENANRMLTNLRVKSLNLMDDLTSANQENTVMTGFTVIADAYRAFDQSMTAALDPVTKQMEKDQEAILNDDSLSKEQQEEKLQALTASYGENVSRVMEELTTVYGGMLKGLKQIYSAEGGLNSALQESQGVSIDELNLSMEHLQLMEVKHEKNLDDIKASIEKARTIVKQEQEQVIDAGKDYGKSVLEQSSVTDMKITRQDLLKMRNNSVSKMLNMMIYRSIASPATMLATTVNTMFNLGSMFSRYNVLV